MDNATIQAKVPACELQAIMHSINQINWYALDLFSLLEHHRYESGSTEDIITPITIDYFAQTGRLALKRQQEMMDLLAEYLDVSQSVCATTLDGILDEPGGAVSKEYFQALKKKEVNHG